MGREGDTHACGCCRHLGVRGIEPLPDHIYPCHLPAEQIILPPSIRPEALGAYHRNFVLPTDGECCSFFENRIALIAARAELEAYEADATGEHYNNPGLNSAIAKAVGEGQ